MDLIPARRKHAFGVAFLGVIAAFGHRQAHVCEIISAAKKAMNEKFATGPTITSSDLAIDFLKIQLGDLEREYFYILWLDSRHKVISFERLFAGTISGVSIHPHEVVKSALKHNAAACIFSHKLTEALALVDVFVLDRLIVGSESTLLLHRGLL